ncbi:MAG: outer membrane biosynthesis protein TonB [Halioglobus sp.]|jgi:outer membrane biosynthesis protein TonB
MKPTSTGPELALPWESSREEDSRFYKILRIMLAITLVVALVIPFLSIPELTREEKEELPPQLARIVLEKKELPPPLPPEPIKPKPVVKKKPEKPKPVEKVAEKPKPKDKAKEALKVASTSGLLAFKDDLMEMRDSLDVDTLSQSQMSRGETSAAKIERSLITSAAKAGSGGIKTSQMSRDTGGSALSGRETTKVQSTIVSKAKQSGKSRSARLGGRSDEAIRREMDRNKGAIFAIYNRALRKDPFLEGKLVFEMVIDASGSVADIKLLSSELSDDDLTRKILSRIRLIRFEAKNVVTTRVNYSFDFLPYT